MTNQNLKILGIDPGTAIVGWGSLEIRDCKLKIINYGVIRTSQKNSDAERLFLIKKELTEIIKKEKPDKIAVEQIFFFKNAKTVISVAQARGVILVTGLELKIPVEEYTPLQVKQAVTGYGRADKSQIQKMVKMILGLKEIPQPDDAADAVAIAICAANNKKF